jgi:hypothetical protein
MLLPEKHDLTAKNVLASAIVAEELLQELQHH